MNPIYTLIFMFVVDGDIRLHEIIDTDLTRMDCAEELVRHISEADPRVEFDEVSQGQTFGVRATREDLRGVEIYGLCVTPEEDT